MAKKAKKVSYSALKNRMIQSLVIVFSILLALFLNEIREQQKVTEDLEIAFKNIRSEVESTRSALDSATEHHLRMIEALDRLLKRPAVIPSADFPDLLAQIFPEGINQPNLQSTAWNTLHMSGLAEHLKYNEIYPFTQLYQLQKDGVESAWQELTKFIAQPERFEKQDNVTNLKTLKFSLNELYQKEKKLLTETDTVLKNPGNWRYLE